MIFSIISVAAFAVTDPCTEWFAKSKLKPGSDCVTRCAALHNGMGTFTCPQECEKLCGKDQKPESKWKKKLKNGRPPKWHTKYEKTKKWTPKEMERVLKVLQSLPKELTDRLKNIYRMDQSVFGSAGQENDGNIVLYDSAFNDKNNLTNVLAHELAHSWYRELSKEELKGYSDAAQWKESPTGRPFPGRPNETFIRDHGRASPEEDFSINVENYLSDPSRLKQVTPKVFNWIDEHYGFWLKLGK